MLSQAELTDFALGLRMHYAHREAPRLRVFAAFAGVVAAKPGDGFGVDLSHAASFYLGAVACLQRAVGGTGARFFMLGSGADKVHRSDITCRVPVEAAEQATRALFSDMAEARVDLVLERVRGVYDGQLAKTVCVDTYLAHVLKERKAELDKQQLALASLIQAEHLRHVADAAAAAFAAATAASGLGGKPSAKAPSAAAAAATATAAAAAAAAAGGEITVTYECFCAALPKLPLFKYKPMLAPRTALAVYAEGVRNWRANTEKEQVGQEKSGQESGLLGLLAKSKQKKAEAAKAKKGKVAVPQSAQEAEAERLCNFLAEATVSRLGHVLVVRPQPMWSPF